MSNNKNDLAVDLKNKAEFDFYQKLLRNEYTKMNSNMVAKGCGIKNIMLTFGADETNLEIISMVTNTDPEVMERVLEEALRVIREGDIEDDFSSFKDQEKLTND